MYQAHRNEETGRIQTVKEHCENTGALAASFVQAQWKDFAYAMGLLHDVGILHCRPSDRYPEWHGNGGHDGDVHLGRKAEAQL